MKIVFDLINIEDLEELTEIMTRSFDDDSKKHLGVEKGGPPGYDNGEFFKEWLLPYKESIGHKILVGDKIIGGAIVWILPHGKNRLGTVFIDPDYQDKGLGTKFWKFIENKYPESKSWTLDTPAFATKNHYFYEKKCGFRKIAENKEQGEEWSSFVYHKVIN
jgi:GNAT superfamily N-acetyltransferase